MNKRVKNDLRDFFRATAEAGFLLPIKFSLHNATGALLREFRIHRDGLELGQAPARPEYKFPLVAVAKSADGRVARVRLAESAAGPVEFVENNRVGSSNSQDDSYPKVERPQR